MLAVFRGIDWWTACAALACYGATIILSIATVLILNDAPRSSTVLAAAVVAAIGAAGLIYLWRSLNSRQGSKFEKSAISVAAVLIAFDLIVAVA